MCCCCFCRSVTYVCVTQAFLSAFAYPRCWSGLPKSQLFAPCTCDNINDIRGIPPEKGAAHACHTQRNSKYIFGSHGIPHRAHSSIDVLRKKRDIPQGAYRRRGVLGIALEQDNSNARAVRNIGTQEGRYETNCGGVRAVCSCAPSI